MLHSHLHDVVNIAYQESGLQQSHGFLTAYSWQSQVWEACVEEKAWEDCSKCCCAGKDRCEKHVWKCMLERGTEVYAMQAKETSK